MLKRLTFSLALTISTAAVSGQASEPTPIADWYPSKYGPADEIGATNLLTPEKDNARFIAGEPGIGLEAAQYLIDRGVVGHLGPGGGTGQRRRGVPSQSADASEKRRL